MRLRGEEWFEHPLQIFGGNPGARVGDRNVHEAIHGVHGDGDSSSLRRRLARVGEQVEKYLLEIALAADDFRTVVRNVHLQIYGAPAHAVLQDGRRRVDGAPHVSPSAPPRGISGKGQHPSENPAADLERLLHVLEILGEDRRRDPVVPDVRLYLLDQRQHRPERVVQIVRHASGQIGHRVLALGCHDPGAQRLGAMQILDGNRRLGSKVLDQFGVERLQLPGMASRDLEHPDETVSRRQRRTQHRRFAKAAMFGAVVVEQIGEGPGGLVRPLAPAVPLTVEAVDFFGLQKRRVVIGHRDSESDPLALRLRPRDLFRDQAQ